MARKDYTLSLTERQLSDEYYYLLYLLYYLLSIQYMLPLFHRQLLVIHKNMV